MLKLKLKNLIKKAVYFCLLAILVAGNFLYICLPKTAQASGNVYDFSNISLTEDVQVSNSPNGPFNNSNFIRVGKDKDLYVQVTIKVASLTNKDSQTVTSFDTKNDAIYFPGWYNTNLAINGVGPSFVAKVTQQQAADIAAKIAAGQDPAKVGGIPCYKQSLTSGGGALINGVVIVGVATAAVLTGGAALSAGALAVGGSAAGTALGAGAQSVALGIALNSSAIAGTAGAVTAATFVPIGPKEYLKCDSPVRPSPQSKGVVKVGDIVYQQVTSVSAASYSALGMGNDSSQIADPTKDASTQPVNEFFVVPDVYFVSWLGIKNDFMSSVGAGKSVYVQLYNTQAQADTHAQDAVPSSVPNNGSNTGSGSDVSGGGSPLLGFINQIIGIILGFIQEAIYFIFYWLIAPIIQSMLSVHTYTDAFAGVIYPGWIVVRNLSNIVFIVALIAIGMATLFRIESYQYKHLLVQLVIAALLVNFSLVIAQAILGVADTIQSQFLPNNVEVVRSLAKDLMVAYRSQIWSLDYVSRGTFSVTVQQLFWLALSLGSFAVFCAIAVFLVIRIVALWVLLLISPIAYVAGVLPTTHHYQTEWWSNFLKYAFFTPIMAFFLNMTAVMIGLQKDNPVLKQIMSNPQSLGMDNFSSFVLSVTSNILLLVFLIAGLKVATQFGIYGANAITSIAQKGIYAPFAGAGFLGKRGFGLVGRKWNEKTTHWFLEGHEGEKSPGFFKKAAFATLNPKAFVKGWGKRSEELSHEAREIAEAGGREVAEQMLTGGKLKIPYRQFVERSAENNYLKDYENMRKESLMESAVAAEGMKGAEGEMRRRAIVKAAAKNGYLDDLLRMTHFAEQFASADGTLYSAEVLNRFLFKYLGHGEQSMRFMAEDMEQLGKDTGHYEYLGHAYYDPEEHNFKRGMERIGEEEGIGGRNVDSLKNTWQVKFAIGELKKVGGRQRAGIAPHNLVSLRADVKRNESGQLEFTEKKDQLDSSVSMGREDGELDEYQLGAIGIFDPATLRDAHFAQSRLKEWIYSRVVDQNTGEIIIRNEQDRKRIEAIWKANPAFMRQMYAQITGVEPKDATGVRMAMLDANGNKTSLHLGEPESMPAPVGTQVAAEVIKNKVFALEKAQKDYLTDNLPTIIGRMYVETYNRSQAIDEVVKAGVDQGKANLIVDDIYNKIAGQLEQRYNPMPVLDAIDIRIQNGDVKQGLSQSVKFALNQKILEKVRDRYSSDKKFDTARIKAHLGTALQQLKTEYMGKPGFEKLEKIEDADLDLIVKDITPILRRDDV